MIVDLQCTYPQRQFVGSVLQDDSLDIVGFGGARGGGKTFVSALCMVLRRLAYADTRGLMLRRTQSSSDQSLKKEIEKVFALLGIPLGGIKYNINEHTFTFPNGSTILLGYCMKDEDYTRYLGVEYADIAWEELTQHERSKFDLVNGSNRSNNPACKPKIWFTCNPGGVGHSWVRELFVDPITRVKGARFIPSLIINNLASLEQDPGYVKRVLDPLPEWQRRQWRDGDWDAISGAYFVLAPHLIRPTFNPACDDNPDNAVQIPYWARWFGGVDFGSSAPFCTVWVAKWKDGSGRNRAHVVKELYRAHLHLDEQAEQVHAVVEGLRDTGILQTNVVYYADPAVAKKVEGLATEAGRTIRSTWANHKFFVLPAHTNARVPGWQLLKYLLYKEILTVDPSCHALISEMRSAIYEGTKGGGAPRGEDIQQGPDVADHALDALRYFCVSTFQIGFNQREPDPYNLNQERTPANEISVPLQPLQDNVSA